MKQMSFAAVVMFFAVIGLLTIGQAAVQGTVKETANFKILVPNGWEFSDFGNGKLQTYNKMGSFMVELSIGGNNMTEADIKSQVATFVKNNKGNGPDKVTMFGLSFDKTTYDKSSMHMSYFWALKDGKKITISLLGPSHETDTTIQEVLKSIQIK
ncbi:MAG: hypothetical protein KJ630_21440 [Proteobacteria bacterium]|nr:hypothetical protein [Pseudomonadota bacterium]